MEKIHYIYLRFSNTKTLASKLIQFWTGSWASHVEFVLPDDKYLGSDITTGVAIVSNFSNINKTEFYKIPVTLEQKELILKLANDEIGKHYDLLALFGNIFRANWDTPDKWFCSELVAYCFLNAGKPLVRYETSRITPLDLIKCPLLIQHKE